MSVTIRPGPEWRHLARRIGDKKLISAATIKAVNTAGKTLRQEIPEILAEIFSTTKAALKIRGRAAHKTQRRDPRYTLSFDQAIQIARLRAKARVFSKARRGHAVGRFILRSGSRMAPYPSFRRLAKKARAVPRRSNCMLPVIFPSASSAASGFRRMR